nr:DUF305 domain-containing protein [Sporichthya sp.]
MTACGNDAPAQPPVSAPAPVPTFNPADVDFAVELSQHHGQALRMTELAATRARAAEITTLATQIARAYAPQTDTVAGWIQAWAAAGAELPAHEIGSGETAPGMLPDAALNRLDRLNGRAFDREFLRLMARHHRGGLDLVKRQLADGINPEARALAAQLQTTQTQQLAQLSAAS